MNPLLYMEAANLFCGTEPSDVNASNHLTLAEVKLPGMNEQYVDHRAGGAPVAIEIDTMIAKLEATFMLAGWTKQVATMIRSWSSKQNQFFVYGVLRDRDSGLPARAVATMKGKLGLADPANWRRGDLQHWSYAIKGIVSYRLEVQDDQGPNSAIYYDWDFFQNKLVINGVDQNADLNALLAIPATPIAV